MQYVSEQHLTDIIFPFVSERYGKIEEVPDYKNDTEGMSQLLGVLERTQNDTYYPSLLEKATYLITAINKGHFFGNGNKRLSLVTVVTFLILNSKALKDEVKIFYTDLLCKIFPEHIGTWEDFPEFSGTDYAMYHLSIQIAKSGEVGVEYDELKKRVLTFFEESVE